MDGGEAVDKVRAVDGRDVKGTLGDRSRVVRTSSVHDGDARRVDHVPCLKSRDFRCFSFLFGTVRTFLLRQTKLLDRYSGHVGRTLLAVKLQCSWG